MVSNKMICKLGESHSGSVVSYVCLTSRLFSTRDVWRHSDIENYPNTIDRSYAQNSRIGTQKPSHHISLYPPERKMCNMGISQAFLRSTKKRAGEPPPSDSLKANIPHYQARKKCSMAFLETVTVPSGALTAQRFISAISFVQMFGSRKMS